jgi:hypothetical protein
MCNILLLLEVVVADTMLVAVAVLVVIKQAQVI